MAFCCCSSEHMAFFCSLPCFSSNWGHQTNRRLVYGFALYVWRESAEMSCIYKLFKVNWSVHWRHGQLKHRSQITFEPKCILILWTDLNRIFYFSTLLYRPACSLWEASSYLHVPSFLFSSPSSMNVAAVLNLKLLISKRAFPWHLFAPI